MNRPYPRRAHNRFKLLVDGNRFIPAMLTAIDSARFYIFLEMYLCESGQLMDRFIDALCRARKREVHVCVLLDDFGSLNLSLHDRNRLLAAGVKLRFFNPIRIGPLQRNLCRDHRKLLIADGQTGFIGGAGLTDDFDPSSKPQDWWHDLMLEIHGDCLIDLQQEFARLWNQSGSDKSTLPNSQEPDVYEFGTGSAQVLVQHRHRRQILATLIRRIRQARQRVLISVAYFVPPRVLSSALRHAAKKGVEVRLILPGPKTDHDFARYAGRRHYGRLLRAGVRIHEYQPRFTHVKLYVCDDWVSLGSSNLDHWTLRWNEEANLGIEDVNTLESCLETFRTDLTESKEITLDQWHSRSRRVRLQEWFWGVLSDWLARHNYRRGLRNPRRHPPRDWRD